jgi:uncharacterized protein (DUF2235 family)
VAEIAQPVAATSRNLVICLDGTGNEVEADASTNVFKLVEILDLSDAAAQLVYYDPGVGTFAAPGAWTPIEQKFSRLEGLAVGHGLRQNLGEAYTWLMQTWQPGDTVFVFGFSRGAYTARALCGMLYRIGLLRSGSENLVPYAVKLYARRPGKDGNLRNPDGWERMDRFAAGLSRPITGDSLAFPVHFLGLFDTVKATRIIGRDFHWPYTDQLPNVATVRHALSIDEKRRPYLPGLVPIDPAGKRSVTETWFAGVHTDVGGGFGDHPELGRISMRWMVDGAVAAGLRVRARRYRARYTLAASDALGVAHKMSWLWALARYRRRTIPPGAHVHASVRDRIAQQPGYADSFARRTQGDVVWDDASWPFGPA